MSNENNNNHKLIKKVEKMLEKSKKSPSQLLERHKIWFYVFVVVSVLGVVNILIPYQDLGIVSFGVSLLLSIILGHTISASIAVAVNLIFSFAILWIPLAIYEYKYFSKVRNYIELTTGK